MTLVSGSSCIVFTVGSYLVPENLLEAAEYAAKMSPDEIQEMIHKIVDEVRRGFPVIFLLCSPCRPIYMSSSFVPNGDPV